ncbi:hypothetical protein MVEN_00289700 [Mycena venus]|uniref:Copper transporter n=1 Tax=Mycena venus TaxID=2733690 RepID=A0A8H6Z5E5_9AGAR|nr:hypothetical protein MVEN_00289700 [Mycena venus]
MPDLSPSEATPRTLVLLLREFLITVALSFLCLFGILHTFQSQIHLFLREMPPCTETSSSTCTPCDRVSLHFAALSPLDILKVTTICAALVLITMEAVARISLHMGWSVARSTRDGDTETGVMEAEAGEMWTDRKAEFARPRMDVISL